MAEPSIPGAADIALRTWAELRIWPGSERDDFLAWAEEVEVTEMERSDPWILFHRWYRQSGMWSGEI